MGSKALLKATQKQCEELFYEQDKEAIDLKRQEKVDVRERFNKEQERRKQEKEKQQVQQPRKKPSRFDRDLDNSQRKYLPKDDGIFSRNRQYDPDFGSGE